MDALVVPPLECPLLWASIHHHFRWLFLIIIIIGCFGGAAWANRRRWPKLVCNLIYWMKFWGDCCCWFIFLLYCNGLLIHIMASRPWLIAFYAMDEKVHVVLWLVRIMGGVCLGDYVLFAWDLTYWDMWFCGAWQGLILSTPCVLFLNFVCVLQGVVSSLYMNMKLPRLEM